MPKILQVITDPNPLLRKGSQEVKKDEIDDPKMKEFIEDMKRTMLEKDGIGLAAPQVAKNIRLVVVNTKDGVLSLINPEIKKRSFMKDWEQEGCLSVPDIFGEVKRNKKIVCHYVDNNGNQIKLKAKGLLARVIQHEIDHLDGVLFIDKAKNIEKVNNRRM